MEGMTTQDQLLGQDDIDALLAGADSEKSSGSSGAEDAGTMEAENSNDEFLGQDDIDTLLSQVGNDKGDKQPDEPPPPTSPDPLINLREKRKVSDEYIRSMSVQIYNRSLLLREPGVQVVWNALNALPMNTGMDLNIQGMEYKTLGVLHTKHLVVKNNV